MKKSQGALVEDVDTYFDFAGAIGRLNVGHTRPRVVQLILSGGRRKPPLIKVFHFILLQEGTTRMNADETFNSFICQRTVFKAFCEGLGEHTKEILKVFS